jgi:hypothetical protein
MEIAKYVNIRKLMASLNFIAELFQIRRRPLVLQLL